jgi:hypothetical protein
VFLQAGHVVRPFSQAIGVTCRSYSLPLQRRMTDFGADVPFGKVSEKLQEHYGISVPTSSARTITERHAQTIHEQEELRTEIPDSAGSACIIAETDGTMVPILEAIDLDTVAELKDKRKARKGCWKEARLALTHPQGSMSPVFGGTIGCPDEVGDQLLNCALRSGMGQASSVHSVGDGAPWIANQVDRIFGAQGEFLVDFYHLSEYLAEAATVCAPTEASLFLETQQQLMKTNQATTVLNTLLSHIEPDSVPDERAPVRCCSRYIQNREEQFHYQEALEKGLPIGSGEIESAHRYIIQNRLKIAGAWWDKDNARHMLSLRILRANGDWDEYWGNN